MAQPQSLLKQFLNWRFIGLILCTIQWVIILSIRIFLGSILPPIMFYPIMGLVGIMLITKFIAFVSNRNDRNISIVFATALINFLMLLSGSINVLMVSAVVSAMGWTQLLVKFGRSNRQYSSYYLAISLFAIVCIAILIAVVSFFMSGPGLMSTIAMLIVNIFSVCFYFCNHPTLFKHYEDIQSYIVISMDFFATSILMYSIYLPLCLIMPSLFVAPVSASLIYMFYAISTAVMTVFIMRPESKPLDEAEFGLVQDDSSEVPIAELVPAENVLMPSVIDTVKPFFDYVKSNILPSAPPAEPVESTTSPSAPPSKS